MAFARATAGSSGRVCAHKTPANNPLHKASLVRIPFIYSTIFRREKFLDQIEIREEAPAIQPVSPNHPAWLTAVRAAEAKQASEIKVLDLTGVTSFTDYFIICTGSNSRQIQAISDEIGLQLKHVHGDLPISLEGYEQAEWVLADYSDFLIHVFSAKARAYYDLERLWRTAKDVSIPQSHTPE
ncbi:MAG: ribosome silencing factor [Acidobacteriota bacterium]|nr:ribosome silencing factor [Acidobacteriota bacterium]